MQTHTLYGLNIHVEDETDQNIYNEITKRIKDITNRFLKTVNRYDNFYATTFVRLDYKRYLICNISSPNALWNNKIQYYKVNWAVCVSEINKPDCITQDIDCRTLSKFDQNHEYTICDNFKNIIQNKLECYSPVDWLCLNEFIIHTKDPELHIDDFEKLLSHLNSKMTLKHGYTEEDIEKDFYIR